MWAGTIAAIPANWLFCDGSAVSRTTYANLFAVTGTIYGVGNGSTTFNLPDLTNRSPMGASQDHAGVPKTNVTGSLTQTGGAATHTLTTTELPAHNHDMSHTHDFNTYPTNLLGGDRLTHGTSTNVATTETTSASSAQFTADTGGGQAHSILDPYLAITFIIYAGP